VLTAAGAVAIGSLGVGDHVLAYDETTGTTASYPISVVHINADPETGTVVIGGEVIETTPEHPFYTLEAGWLDAEDLEPGMHVPSASGEPGEVSSVDFAARPAIMYNLTVEVAHTFFVGEGEWLVHNTGCDIRWDPNVQRYRGTDGRFAPGSRSSRVVIGETMERVRDAAIEVGGSFYNPTRFSGAPRTALRASARRNYQWIERKIRQGAQIFDKGRDATRAKRSVFYYLEQRAIRKHKYSVTKL
jgi:hypothetical protein